MKDITKYMWKFRIYKNQLMEYSANIKNKIIDTACEVFHQKGLKMTRIGDITQTLDIDKSVINTYFGSKESLFEAVMKDSAIKLLEGVKDIINNPNTNFEQKIDLICAFSDKILSGNRNLPLYILNDIENNPEKVNQFYLKHLGGELPSSIFFTQYQEYTNSRESLLNQYLKMMEDDVLRNLREERSPYDLFVHIICLCVFPYLLGSLSLQSAAVKEIFVFDLFMEGRAEMNSRWIKKILRMDKS